MNKLKKNWLSVFTLTIIASMVGYWFFFSDTEKTKQNWQEIIVQINKSCPTMIDEYTRLDSVVVLKTNAVRYNYTVLGVNDTIDFSAFEGNMRLNLLEELKREPELTACRREKVDFIYRYLYESGKPMFSIKLTADDYLKK